MLTFYGSTRQGPIVVGPQETALAHDIDWIDAFDPTPDDYARLATILKRRVPTLNDLVEIESSSRLAVDQGAVVMSLPAVVKDETGAPKSTPIGFIVTADHVVTIRFARLPSFDQMVRQICDKGDLSKGGFGAAVHLIEILVDQIADLLERTGADLDGISREIFSSGLGVSKGQQPRRSSRILTALLQAVGHSGDLASKVSETLLGLSRMAPYLAAKATPPLPPDLKNRLDTVTGDAKSLHEYQEHLSNKTQFLLDMLLGLANIEQNNVFRVLTVVSVIGIPPTFIASMYGMNFKTIPEYDWTYGYAYGLTLIALSAIVPAVWFKVKGWW